MTFKQQLQSQLQYYQHIVSNLEKSETVLPEGTLRITSCGKHSQFHQVIGDKDVYIPASNKQLAADLAQKKYNQRILDLARKRCNQLQRILSTYQADEVDQIYLSQHPARRQLVQPCERLWEEQLRIWFERPYAAYNQYEDKLTMQTENGEWVRSKSEKILADYFKSKGILYKYECPLSLNGSYVIHPDFTFLSPYTKKEIYWEHNGMMDDPLYADQAVKKINQYVKANILPGERLIVTYETKSCPLSMDTVKKYVHHFLL